MSTNQTEEASSSLKRKEYEKELRKLQTKLCNLQDWIVQEGLRVIIVLEGRDAAGKGGTIKAITERVSPRSLSRGGSAGASDREKTQLYIQRYIQHFPAAGEVLIFDRSWYNRAGVEYVMGFLLRKNSTTAFVENCPKFESHIIKSGIILINSGWRSARKSSASGFEARIEDPVRQWKLSPMDLESYSHWYDYSRRAI